MSSSKPPVSPSNIRTDTDSVQKHYGVAFGSNYFHPFGKYAIPISHFDISRSSGRRFSCCNASTTFDTSSSMGEKGEPLPQNAYILPLNPTADMMFSTSPSNRKSSEVPSCSNFDENNEIKEYEQHHEIQSPPRRTKISGIGAMVPPNVLDVNEETSQSTSNEHLNDDEVSSGYSPNKPAEYSNQDKDSNKVDAKRHGTASKFPSMNLPPDYATASNPITSIALGATHTMTLLKQPTSSSSSTLYQTGTLHGITHSIPCALQTRIPLNCTQIACGKRHTLALFENQVVMSWGSGYFGQLGHGMEMSSCSSPKIVERLLPHHLGGRVVFVAAGGMHSAVIVNESGVLPSAIQNHQQRGESNKKTMTFSWGGNRAGQCGVKSGKSNAVPFPMPIAEVTHPEAGRSVSFISLSLGKLHSVGLTALGEVYSWGSTSMGRLGHGDSSSMRSRGTPRSRFDISLPRRVEALRNVRIKQVSAGDGHTLALSNSGARVFSWGCGSDGQLGHGHAMHLLSPRVVADLEFGNMKCLRSTAGSKSALSNMAAEKRNISATASGEICDDEKGTQSDNKDGSKLDMKSKGVDESSKSLPENSTTATTAGSKVDELESSTCIYYPPTPQKAAQNTHCKPPTISSIHASGCYSAALSSSGDLYTWGYGDGGQLGHALPQYSSELPSIEPGPMTRTGAGQRTRDSVSFDSRLNVLLPRRVECLRTMGLKVNDISAGPSGMIAICSNFTKEELEDFDLYDQGKTQFDLEEEKRNKGLGRLRAFGVSRTLSGSTSLSVESNAAGAVNTSAEVDLNVADENRSAKDPGSMDRKISNRSCSNCNDGHECSQSGFEPVEGMINESGSLSTATRSTEATPKIESIKCPPTDQAGLTNTCASKIDKDGSPLLEWMKAIDTSTAKTTSVEECDECHSQRKNKVTMSKEQYQSMSVEGSGLDQKGSATSSSNLSTLSRQRNRFKSPFRIRRGSDGKDDQTASSSQGQQRQSSSRLLKMGRARRVLNAALGGGSKG